MDSSRAIAAEFDLSSAEAVEAPQDVAAVIGTDERRMHVRAYNYWVSLLDGRDFPSIEDLEPGDVQDFSAHSVLLDFTCGGENPAIPYVGAAIRDECALDDDMRTIADVPSRSLLSRLTDHYMQIIANRAPVGFEAEFENPGGETICYRGILMPFSSDSETIDFIYGVINWKHVADAAAAPQHFVPAPSFAVPHAVEAEEALGPTRVIPLEARVSHSPEPDGDGIPDTAPVPFTGGDEGALPEFALDEDAGLADRLWAARETADAVKAGEGRTRAALYRALSLAYDFALAAAAEPEDYADLLAESGVKAQARAPMTAIVKLVFGIDYDKARLTEFAAALSFGRRQQLPFGAFDDFIQKQAGGLKALVAAERQARRPETSPDTRSDQARARLRGAAPIALADIAAEQEFVLVLTRRGADGLHQAVAVVDDEVLVERAIRQAR